MPCVPRLQVSMRTFSCWIRKGSMSGALPGKGTFGTEELVRMIDITGLAAVVNHRKIIVPQLGAPGISWPEVLRRCGFLVEYGPVTGTRPPGIPQDPYGDTGDAKGGVPAQGPHRPYPRRTRPCSPAGDSSSQ